MSFTLFLQRLESALIYFLSAGIGFTLAGVACEHSAIDALQAFRWAGLPLFLRFRKDFTLFFC